MSTITTIWQNYYLVLLAKSEILNVVHRIFHIIALHQRLVGELMANFYVSASDKQHNSVLSLDKEINHH